MTARSVTDTLANDPRVQRRRLATGASVPASAYADHVFAVLEGALALESTRFNADPRILEIVGPRSGIVRGKSLLAAPAPVFLRALSPTTFVRMSETDFNRLVASDGALARSLATQLGDRTAELRERIAAGNSPTARGRVADALLYLDDKLGQSCPLAPGHRLVTAQATVAAVAGLTRQSTNRALRELQTLGLVRLERSMTCLLDHVGLESLSAGKRLRNVWVPTEHCKLLRADAPLSCHPLRPAPISLVPLTLRRSIAR